MTVQFTIIQKIGRTKYPLYHELRTNVQDRYKNIIEFLKHVDERPVNWRTNPTVYQNRVVSIANVMDTVADTISKIKMEQYGKR